MHSLSILLLSLLSGAEAFWRLPCGRIQLGRVDPIISPGQVSGHVHTVSGPNNFGVSSTSQSLTGAYCTSCPVQSDKSAYWTPQLYYRYGNGTFTDVGNGGTIVYYLDRGDNLSEMVPFPEGFKMVSGDPGLRSSNPSSVTWNGKRAIGDRVSFLCVNYQKPEAETNSLGNTNCPQGLRAQIQFPSCWDGVNLYKNNQSHVAYLDRIDNGACPPSHPKLLPHLFYEIYYDVAHVQLEPDGYYVFAQGDATGYGFHGDFQNGWDTQVLTNAISQCMGPNAVNDGGSIEGCPPFAATLDGNAGRNCPQQPSVINETVTGLLSQLPGCNPPSFGPGRVAQQVCPVQPNINAGQNGTGVRQLPAPGDAVEDFAYVGCARDNNNLLPGIGYSDNQLTVSRCANFCRQSSYRYSGLKNGRDCACGNYIMDSLQSNGKCTFPGVACGGNVGQFCGGDGVMHIYNDTKSSVGAKPLPQPGRTQADLGSGVKSTYLGCFNEADGRALKGDSFADGSSMTNELCGQFCSKKGFALYGTEYAQVLRRWVTPEFVVNKPNLGLDIEQELGRVIYYNVEQELGSVTHNNVEQELGRVIHYNGCVNTDSQWQQTLELCAQRAADKNFRYFGLEYSSECYLADVINPASVRLDESKCSMPCSGNQKQLCGGSMAISLFNNTRYTPRIPLAIQTSSGRNFTYQGCFSDQGNPRTLGAYSISQGSNTVEACAQLCSSKGYSWAGVEYGAECYCGNAGTGAASLKSDTECSKPCAGNAKQNCGGGFALQVYRQNTA